MAASIRRISRVSIYGLQSLRQFDMISKTSE